MIDRFYFRILVLFCVTSLSGCVSPVPMMHQENTAAIEQLLKQSTQVNKAVTEPKTKEVSAVPTKVSGIPEHVLRALAPSSGGLLNQVTNPDAKRFSVAVKDQPARAFFLSLAKGSDDSIMVSPQISGLVTLSLDNVTLPDVLEATRNAYGYEYQRTAYGYDILPRRLETRVFNINHLNINRMGSSSITVGSAAQLPEAGSGSTGTDAASNQNTTGDASQVNTINASDFWNKLEQAIRLIVGQDEENSKEHAVVVNHDSGVILVRAYPNELQQVASFLDKTQKVMRRQVIIEAKIVEVALSKNFEAGIDWGLAKGDLERLGMQFNPFGGSNSGFVIRAAGNNFATAMNLLSKQGTTSVLSSPRISTLNNQKAVIKVGTDEYFSTNYTTNTATTTTGTTFASDLNLKPFFSGVALDVTPQIDQDGSVTLHIHPVISEVLSEQKTFVGSTQTSASRGLLSGSQDNGTVTMTLAKSNIRESDSIVHSNSGEIVVIGGLMQRLAHTAHQQLPSVGGAVPDILSGKSDKGRKSELVILLRAIVIDQPSDWNNHLSRTLSGFSNIKS